MWSQLQNKHLKNTHLVDNGLENTLERVVIDALLERKVHGVVLARLHTK